MAKLLIVDDEVDVREFIANFFRKRNINVITASSGKEALEQVGKQRPNLVLLDIKMPDMDGIEVLKSIREKDKAVKVIMVTGKSPEDENAFNTCRQFGAVDYIHKPLEIDSLEKKVLNELK